MSTEILRKSFALLTFVLVAATGMSQAQVTRTWSGGTNGTWNTASNWTPSGIPASGDNVIITGGGTIDLAGGPTTVNDLSLASKVLSGTSTLTINGTFSWNSGTLAMSAGVTANGAVSLETGGAKYLSTTLDLNNTTTWSGGYVYMTDGAVFNNTTGQTMTATHESGAYFVRSGAPFAVEPVFNNVGTFVKNAQDVNGNNTTIQGISGIQVVFNNTGSVQVNLGTPNPTTMTGTSEVEITFEGTSTGSFTVVADAILNLKGNQTLNGVSISGAGEVDFAPTTNQLIDLTGAYTYNVTGTTRHAGSGTGRTLFNVGTVTSVGDVILSGGRLDFQNGGTISPLTYEQSGGSSYLQGTSPVAVSGLTTWKAGYITTTGDFDANGPAVLETGGAKYLSTTLDLNNTTTWSGGYVYMTDGAVFNNTTGQTMTATHESGAYFVRSGAPFAVEPVFNNVGTFVKNAQDVNGNNTTIQGISGIQVVFNNTGSVQVNLGTPNPTTMTGTSEVEITFEGTSTGSFTVVADAILNLKGNQTLNGVSISGAGEVDFAPTTNQLIDLTGAYTYNVTGTTRHAGSGTGRTLFNVGTVTSVGNVILSGGRLDFQNGGTISPLTYEQSGGSSYLQGTSPVAVSGLTTWKAGYITTTGDFDANGPAVLETGGAKYLSTTLDLNNTTTWSGGYVYMTDGAVFNNTTGQTMTATHESGAYFVRSGAPFAVEPVFNNVGTFVKNAQDVNGNNTTIQGISGIQVVFNNTGSVQVNLGTPNPTTMTGTSEVEITFEGTSTGSFTVVADAILNLKGNQTLNGVSISGAGEVDFAPTTNQLIDLTGAYTYNVTGTTRHAGSGTGRTLFNVGTVTSVGNVILSGARLDFQNGGTISPLTYEQSGGSSYLQGTSPVAISGLTTWKAGYITTTGDFDANGPAVLETGGAKYLSTTLDLNNTTTWSGGYVYMTDGAVFNNTTGQTMTATHESGAFFVRSGAPFAVEPVFNNVGTFVKNAQDVNGNFTTIQGISGIQVVFNNTGSVQVNLGTPNPTNMTGTSEVEITFEGTSTGSFTVVADAILNFKGNQTLNGVSISGAGEVDFAPTTNQLIDLTGAYTYNVTGTTRHAGSGTGRTLFNVGTVTSVGDVILSGGRLDFQNGGTISPLTYEQSGGSTYLQGTSPIAVSGQTTWKGGRITIAGGFDANGPASLETTTKYLETTMDLNNTTTWSGGYVYMTDGAVLNNTAGQTMTATHETNVYFQRSGAPFAVEPVFNNLGTFVKNAEDVNGNFTTVSGISGIDLVFNNSGSVQVNAGTPSPGASGASLLQFSFAGTNSGTMTVSESTELAINALNGQTFTNTATGLIEGDGLVDIDPDFINSGAFGPGTSAGQLDYQGVYDQTSSTAAFNAEIGGTSPGTGHDRLDVEGAAQLGGVLNASVINSYAPTNGQSFVVLTATGGRTGTFQTINAPGFDVQYNSDNVTLIANVQVVADLGVTKTVDQSDANVGDNVTFTVTLTNNGPSTATSITVNDALPNGLTYVSDTPSAGSYNQASGDWTLGTLNNGASETLTVVATVASAGAKTNTASITSLGQTDNNGANDSDSADVTGLQIDIAIIKAVNNDFPDVGSQVVFTITANSNGPSNATNVLVSDVLPTGLSYVSDVPSQGSYNSSTGVWTAGTINSGANATLQITASVDQPGLITNTATFTQADQPDSNSNNNSFSVMTQQRVDVAIAKTVDNASPAVNDNVTFTVTATNNGPSTATGVTLTDLLPAGLTYVSDTPSQGSYVSGTGVWTVGTLADAASATLQITATVSQAGTITNTSSLTSVDQPDSDNSNDSDSVTLSSTQADIAVTKTASASEVNVGSNVTFTVTVTNSGPSAATGVAVTDALPTGLTYVSDTPSQGTYNSGTGLWTVGSLANGASATLQLVATVTSTATAVNTASVSASDQADPNTNNNTATASVTGLEVDIAMSKTVDNASPDVNDNVTFTVTATNNGPSGATGIVVTDLLPAGLTYVSDNPSQGGYVSGTGLWTLGSLASGASATLEVVATLTQSGSVTNTAAVTAVDQPDSDAGNDTASQTLSGTQADIAVTKTVSASEVNRGSNVTFTVTATNNGPDDATGVDLTDALPNGLTYVSDTPSQGSYASGTGVWAVGALANGASATLEIVATVTGTATVTNTASVTASDQADPEVENNLGLAQVTGLEVDIAVTKTVDNASPTLNSNAVFTITATNNGPSAATGVALTDLLPAGLTYVSDTPSQGAYVSGTGLWTLGGLASGASATLAITATVTTEGSTTNTAAVTAVDQPDSDAGNDTDSQTVTTPMGGTLEGTVLDVAFDESSGKTESFAGLTETPLEGAEVELLLDGASVASTTTGTDGTFSFDLSGKTKGLAYELRLLASGTVPETASDVDVRKTVAGVTEGSFQYRLPLTLAIQKYSLVYALENLAVPASLLMADGASPVPLPVIYNEAATTALMTTWLGDVGVNRTQIVESMARLLIAEIVLSELYDNAIWMSHETASTMFSLIRGFLITQGMALEIQDGFRTRISNKIGQRIAQRHIAIMNRYVQRLFLEEPSKLAIASLPADCLPLLEDALLAILGAASNANLLGNVDNTALHDGLTVEGDKVLAGWYVNATQEDLDQATTWAEAFDYTGTSGEAWTAVQSVIGASDAAASAASAQAGALRDQSNINEILDKVLTHRGRVPNLGNLISMYRQLKRARFAVLARSVVVNVTELKRIEAQDAPEGTDKAFHPVIPLAVETYSDLQAASEAVSSPALDRLAATSDAYRQALDDVVTAFREGRRSEAIGQFGSILDLDDELSSDLFAAQAPVVAAAENASAQVAGFDASFDQLTDAVAGSGLERTLFYTQLLQIADDDQYPADSLATQVDSVKTSLDAAENGITDATGLVQGVDARPYVAVSELGQERDKVGIDDTLRVTATVKNLGATDADDVVVTLTADAAALVVSQASFTIGTLAPDEAQTFEFALKVVDGTQAVRGYRVELASSNALAVPANGSYNVGLVVGIEEVTAEIPTSYGLGQSYPNPFNPQTTITFSVPVTGSVTIHVFDILGREISRLVDEVVAPGTFQATFDAGDLPSGTYFYRMQAGDFTAVRSMILVK